MELRGATLPTPAGYTSPFTPIQNQLATIREVPYREVYCLCKEFGVECDNLLKGGGGGGLICVILLQPFVVDCTDSHQRLHSNLTI